MAAITEQEVLIAAICSPEFRKEAFDLGLEPSDFSSDIHGWITKTVLQKAGSDVLNFSIAGNLLNDDPALADDESTRFMVNDGLIAIFKELKRREKKEEPLFYPEISANIVRQMKQKKALKDIIVSSSMKVNEGSDPLEVFNEIKDKISKNKEIFGDKDEYEIYNILEEFTDRIDRREDFATNGKTFTFKDPCLREAFPLGIMQREMFSVCADTGVGKSVSMDNFAIEAIQDHNLLNTLIIKTENEEIQTSSRLDSIFSGKSYLDVYTGDLDQTEIDDIDADYKAVQQKGVHLFLVQVIPNCFDANTIEKIIDQIYRDHGVTIEMLIVDSPEHQAPIEKQDAYFLRKAVPYMDLKELMKRKNLILFTTVQRKIDSNSLFRKSKTKKEDDDSFSLPEPEQAAGSAEIGRTVDYMVMLMKQTPRDKMLDAIKFAIVKSRNVEKKADYYYLKRDSNNLRQSFMFQSDMGGLTSVDKQSDGSYFGSTVIMSDEEEALKDFDEISF